MTYISDEGDFMFMDEQIENGGLDEPFDDEDDEDFVDLAPLYTQDEKQVAGIPA